MGALAWAAGGARGGVMAYMSRRMPGGGGWRVAWAGLGHGAQAALLWGFSLWL